jgi:uncharacterized linocin/CFP29 family protein
MNHLLRERAPITEAAWSQIDEEARGRLAPALAGRRVVDFAGPRGWDHSASNLGRVTTLTGGLPKGIEAQQRRVLPLVELRAPFSVSRAELRDLDRGAPDVDFGALDAAAQRIAAAENAAVFHGLPSAGIVGIAEQSTHRPIPLGKDDFDRYPTHVAEAVEMLLSVGIEGPYGLALGPDGYTGVIETAEHGGYPLLEHLEKITGGPIVFAPGLEGAVVASLRGGDFLFDCGQDVSVGYDGHDADEVRLYLEESFSFRVATPEAGVALELGGPAAPRSRGRRRK